MAAGIRFDWDPRKDRSNHAKHGVSFEEAQTVFLDDNALLIGDPDHSDDEARFVLLGLSSTLRALVVCHCCRGDGDVIRINFSSQGRQVRAGTLRAKDFKMRKNYDFSKARRNPYAKRLKRQVTIRLDETTLDYFKLVTVKAITTLFNAVAGREDEKILSILVEFEGGSTAELTASAPQAQMRVDYPIDDVILGRPVVARYRYTVTVIRANGRQDRDTQPREQSASVFFVSVVR